jgi:hypothetical protein
MTFFVILLVIYAVVTGRLEAAISVVWGNKDLQGILPGATSNGKTTPTTNPAPPTPGGSSAKPVKAV